MIFHFLLWCFFTVTDFDFFPVFIIHQLLLGGSTGLFGWRPVMYYLLGIIGLKMVRCSKVPVSLGLVHVKLLLFSRTT